MRYRKNGSESVVKIQNYQGKTLAVALSCVNLIYNHPFLILMQRWPGVGVIAAIRVRELHFQWAVVREFYAES